MQISDKEKKKRQHEKELNSLRNKMGVNIVWFDSLSLRKKYDILFGWKRLRKVKTRQKPEFVEITKRVPIDPLRPWGRKKLVKVTELWYPPSLKHYIKDCRKNSKYQPRVQNIRETSIDMLLSENKK